MTKEALKELEKQFEGVPQEGRLIVKVESTFNDSVTNRLYAPGYWPMSKEHAHRLCREGRATYVREEDAPLDYVPSGTAPVTVGELSNDIESKSAEILNLGKEPPTTEAHAGTEKDVKPKEFTVDEQTMLPTNFPEREVLIESGYDTVEKLRLATEQDLIDLPKIGQAKATKIGLALAEIK